MVISDAIINILESQPNFAIQQSLPDSQISQIAALVITFDLILLATLNHVKLSQLPLFKIYFRDFQSQINMVVSKNFDFLSSKYQGQLKVQYSPNQISKNHFEIDNHQYKQKGIQKITILYEFTQSMKENLKKSDGTNKVSLQFGDPNKTAEFKGRFSILNFNIRTQTQSNLRHQLINIDQKAVIENYDFTQGSFPIVYLRQLGNFQSLGIQLFKNLLSSLPPYSAPNTEMKKNHLFVCHDMKGGYKEQTQFNTPIQMKRGNSYRFNYFHQTEIFNYFSHKAISVPPKHWRQLCKKYSVKCLGTFIVEADKVDENYYLTEEFVFKLVYLAKKYKFDGYLINIQNEVKNEKNLEVWLKNLTTLIHKQIPNSIISWYDSVSIKGIIEYQNQINDINKIFYELTDNFYTNYWWSNKHLDDDIKNKINNKTIYVGNDVWGRGTFGGGQYNLYVAIDQIQKKGDQILGSALFGPGYTYQTGGQNNDPYLYANEDNLYRGVSHTDVNITRWNQSDISTLKTKYNLQDHKEWFASQTKIDIDSYQQKKMIRLIYSFQVNKELKQSNLNLDYKIQMLVQSSLSSHVYAVNFKQIDNLPLSQNSVRKFSLFLNTSDMDAKCHLKITKLTTIKDVFIKQKLFLKTYNKPRDWIEEVPFTKHKFSEDYNTFFNIGYGRKFHYQGNPMNKHYDYMADYDLPHTLSINHPLITEIQFDHSYVGGSSLIIEPGDLKLFQIQIENNQNQFPATYFLKIIYKKGSFKFVSLAQMNGVSVYFQKVSEKQLDNSWKQNIYTLTNADLMKIKNEFFHNFDTFLMITVEKTIILGHIYLNPDPPKPLYLQNSQSQIRKSKLQLFIGQSFKVAAQSNEIYLNFQLYNHHDLGEAQIPSGRFLVLIENNFAAFIYVQRQGQKSKGILTQIPIIKNQKSVDIKILDMDNNFKQIQLISQIGIDLQTFSQKQLDYRIHLKNF